MKGLIIIVEVTKAEGKILNQIVPDLVSTTYHKRHYYVVECEKTWKTMQKLGMDTTRYVKKRRK